MIQIKTNLSVSDNSGAKEVSCIKVLGSSKYTHANCQVSISVSLSMYIFIYIYIYMK